MLCEFVVALFMFIMAALGVLLGILLLLLYLAIEAPELLEDVLAVAKRKKGENANLQ